jgi:hypothetical protein
VLHWAESSLEEEIVPKYEVTASGLTLTDATLFGARITPSRNNGYQYTWAED